MDDPIYYVHFLIQESIETLIVERQQQIFPKDRSWKPDPSLTKVRNSSMSVRTVVLIIPVQPTLDLRSPQDYAQLDIIMYYMTQTKSCRPSL